MIKPGLKHPGFAAQLRSGEAFRPKTMHPTSPGSALHLAHSGAFYSKRNNMTSCNFICMFCMEPQYAQDIYACKLEILVVREKIQINMHSHRYGRRTSKACDLERSSATLLHGSAVWTH